MRLRHLSLTNFKNFEHLVFEPSEGLNCIIGPNGSGKTNLLDAIYYCCMARSYFQASDRNNIRHGTDFFRLESVWYSQHRDHELVIKRKSGERSIEWDGEVAPSASAHLGRLPVVMIVPNETYTLLQDHDERRKLINQTLVQTDQGYLSALMDYHRLLEQKVALLKSGRIRGSMPDVLLLESYEASMEGPAKYIFEARKRFCEEMNPLIGLFSGEISNGRQQSEWLYSSDLLQGDIRGRWLSDRERDLASGRVASGIHRDKIECRFNGQSLKNFGSQGQIKTFIMALRLAQVRYLMDHTRTKPVLLLDDLFAKLDETRVQLLVRLVRSMGIGQFFITDTHMERALALIGPDGFSGKVFTFEGDTLQCHVQIA